MKIKVQLILREKIGAQNISISGIETQCINSPSIKRIHYFFSSLLSVTRRDKNTSSVYEV